MRLSRDAEVQELSSGRLVTLMAPSGSLPPLTASNVTLVLNFFRGEETDLT
jgi:hypothetical protein